MLFLPVPLSKHCVEKDCEGNNEKIDGRTRDKNRLVKSRVLFSNFFLRPGFSVIISRYAAQVKRSIDLLQEKQLGDLRILVVYTVKAQTF